MGQNSLDYPSGNHDKLVHERLSKHEVVDAARQLAASCLPWRVRGALRLHTICL